MAPSLPRMGYLEPRLDWGYHGLRYRLRQRGGGRLVRRKKGYSSTQYSIHGYSSQQPFFFFVPLPLFFFLMAKAARGTRWKPLARFSAMSSSMGVADIMVFARVRVLFVRGFDGGSARENEPQLACRTGPRKDGRDHADPRLDEACNASPACNAM